MLASSTAPSVAARLWSSAIPPTASSANTAAATVSASLALSNPTFHANKESHGVEPETATHTSRALLCRANLQLRLDGLGRPAQQPTRNKFQPDFEHSARALSVDPRIHSSRYRHLVSTTSPPWRCSIQAPIQRQVPA